MTSLDAEREGALDAGAAGPKFIRGAGFRVAGYVVGMGVGAIVTPFVTRHLGTVGWGRYVTVSSVLFITVAIIEGGLNNMGVREFSTQPRAGRDDYMSALLGLRVVLSMIGTIGVVAFSLLAGYDSVLVTGVAIGCLGMLLSTLQATLGIALTARLRMGWQTVIDFVSQTLTAATLAFLVVAGSSLIPFFGVTTLVAAVTLTITIFLVRGDITFHWTIRPGLWIALLRQSGIYAAAAALGVIYFQVVAVAVSLLANAHQVGYFDLGFRVLSLLNGIPWLVVTGAFPILARAADDDHARLQFAHQRLIEAALIVGGWVSISVVVGAPFIVTVIGGTGFGPSVEVLRILGAGIIGTYLLATWSFTLLSLEMYRELIIANGVAVVMAVVLSIVLISPLGANGAAIVTAALEVILAGSYAVALFRRQPELTPRLAPVMKILGVLVVAFATAAVAPIPAVPKVMLETAVLAVLLWRTGAIPSEVLPAALRR